MGMLTQTGTNNIALGGLIERLGRGALAEAGATAGVTASAGSEARTPPVTAFASQALQGLDMVASNGSPDVAGRALAVQVW
jgi:hypothetical protein